MGDHNEIDLHVFDTCEVAQHYLTVSRGYTFDHHKPWTSTDGIDFYKNGTPGLRASLRKRADGRYGVAFWGISKDHPND